MGAGGSQQVHDFNPGEENGLFWTIPIPSRSVQVDVEDGTADFALSDFPIDDYGNVGNAISGGSDIGSAKLSLHVRWSAPTHAVSFTNAGLPTPFAAKGFDTQATMTWSAVETIGGVTDTVSGATNSAVFGRIAKERNGAFFRSSHEDREGQDD